MVGTGLVLMLNGALRALTALASWQVLLGVAAAVSLTWLARLEVDHLDRVGSKPRVMRH